MRRWSWTAAAPAAALLFGLVYLLAGRGLALQSSTGPGPGLIPLLAGLLVVASAAWALATGASAVPSGTAFPRGEAAWRVPALLGLLASYLVLLPIVGHLIVMIPVASAATWVLGRRPWWAAVAVGVGMSVGSWALFELVLGVPLPAGLFD